MAKFKIPYQNLTYNIPDQNEVFTLRGTIYFRDGNTLKWIDPQALAFEELGQEPFKRGGEFYGQRGRAEQEGKKILKEKYDIDFNEIPHKNYNMADVTSVFTKKSAGLSRGGTNNPEELKKVMDKPEVEDEFVQEISAANVHAPVIKHNEKTIYDPEGAGADPDATVGDILGSTAGGSSDNNLTQEQQTRFDELVSAGADEQTALNAVKQIQGDTGTTPDDTDTTTDDVDDTDTTTDDSVLGTGSDLDFSDLENSPEYQALSDDQKTMVKAVYEGVASNDAKVAQRFAGALKTAENLNDPYFGSLLRMASDAITRGFVSIDNEEAFKEEQLRNNLKDLRQDIQNKQEFLTLEESNTLRGIERQFEQNLEKTQQNLAASGMTFSTRRAKKESLLEAEREDMVESTTRKFGFEKEQAQNRLARGERDTAAEIERLSELSREGRLDLLREAESKVGTKNLGDLPQLSGVKPLGDVTGDIEERRAKDTLSAAKSLVF